MPTWRFRFGFVRVEEQLLGALLLPFGKGTYTYINLRVAPVAFVFLAKSSLLSTTHGTVPWP